MPHWASAFLPLTDMKTLMNDFTKALCSAVIIALLVSCTDGKANNVIEDWPWEDPVMPEQPEEDPGKEYLDLGWTNVGKEYGVLPEYINVYKSPSNLLSKSAVAYIAVADMEASEWDVWSVESDMSYKTDDSYMTPSQIYDAEKCPVVINGGYFFWSDGNYTSSLAVSKGKVLAYNINYASEDWVTVYSPTRAAFVQTANGKFDACWTYAATDGKHFTYQVPAANSYSRPPLEVPSETFPEKAVKFKAQTAIGGGPVLINAGEIVNTWEEELFEVGGVEPDSSHPRTAIGITADRRMIMFVCEGRNMTEGVKGFTTEEVAEIMKELGCVEAINLDGGGSSCMLVNGKETIRVSDGSQRAVASAVMFK